MKLKYKVGQRVKYLSTYFCSSTVKKGVSEIRSIQSNFSYPHYEFYYLKDGTAVTEEEIIGLDLPPRIRSGKLLW